MQRLKYGENPQQAAWFQGEATDNPLAAHAFRRLDGSAFIDDTVSTNSLKDWYRAIRVVSDVQRTINHHMFPYVAVIVKHGNPCGAAVGADTTQVLRDTCLGDEEAAFGGFLVANFPLTEAHGKELASIFSPVILAGVAAPMIDGSFEAVTERKANRCHLVENFSLVRPPAEKLSWPTEESVISGGRLRQEPNPFLPLMSKFVLRSEGNPRPPATSLARDVPLGCSICKFSTSNTVTIVKDGKLIGNGCGQQKRKLAARVALVIADDMGHDVEGSTVVSDGFFSHVDAIELLGERRVKVVVAPSGSRSDGAVFKRALDYGIEMYTVPTEVGRMFFGH